MEPTQATLKINLIVIGALLLVFFCGLVFFLLKFRGRQARHITELMLSQIKTREKILRQISRDLHDEVGSSLSGIRLFAQMAKLQVNAPGDLKLVGFLEKIDEYSLSVIEKTSDMVWMFQPENDTAAKMLERLQQYTQSLTAAAGISLEFQLHQAFTLTITELGYRRNIYLICKEAVNNAVKHSGCTKLCLCFENNIISITDNGNGFDYADQLPGNGLTNIQNRAKESGINLSVQSEPGNGTVITLHL